MKVFNAIRIFIVILLLIIVGWREYQTSFEKKTIPNNTLREGEVNLMNGDSTQLSNRY